MTVFIRLIEEVTDGIIGFVKMVSKPILTSSI